MTLLLSAPLGGPGGYAEAQSIQTDSFTYAPGAVPDGVPGRMEWVPDPLGQRGTVLRCQLGAWTAESGTYGNRSEINFPSEPVTAGNAAPRWYRWSCMVPSGSAFQADDRYFCIAQIHDDPDAGDGARWPNFSLYAGIGELLVMLPRVHPPTDGDAGSRVAGRYPLVRDRWMDIQLGVNLSLETTGWIEVIIDGNLVVREWGHGTAYNDVAGPWHKLGVYNIFKHATPPTGIIATAYFSACEHHAPPYAPGATAVQSVQAA